MYEESKSTVTEKLAESSATVFTQSTISSILSLTAKNTDITTRFDDATPDANGNVTVAAGAEVVFVKTSDTVQTVVTAPVNAPVVIFQGAGGVNATVNDGAAVVGSAAGVVDRVVVGTAGADKIVIADDRNSLVTIGGGDTVVAGSGADTIVAGTGNSTVQGGTGYAIVQLTGSDTDYTVTVVNGNAVVTNNASGFTTDISKIQFVQLDGGEALVFAKNSKEAAVASLYEATFGRAADANGLDFWFDRANEGVSLKDIATGFTNSAEYAALGTVSNSAFVSNLYTQMFGRSADAGGLAFYTNVLTTGAATRADLLADFTMLAAQNIDGTATTEATIIGSVSIITTIV